MLLLSLFLFFSLTLIAGQTPKSPCTFWFPDSGYEFDLSALRDYAPSYSYQVSGLYSFAFSVCGNITGSPCPPSGSIASVLQVPLPSGTGCAANRGYLPSQQASLISSDPTQGLVLNFKGDQCLGPFPGTYTSQFVMSCNSGMSRTGQPFQVTSVSVSSDSCGVTFNLNSPFACPYEKLKTQPGLSTAYVVLIIVAALIAAYFCIGIFYKRYKYSATGMESIPNIDTWRMLGGFCCCSCLRGGGHSKLSLQESDATEGYYAPSAF